MKDYDFELAYHLGKANVVVDALSRKSYMANLLASQEWRLMTDMADAEYKVLRQQRVTFVVSLSVYQRFTIESLQHRGMTSKCREFSIS